MSRKTTARRSAIAALAATAIVPGFALGIAGAATSSDPVVSGVSTPVVKGATAGTVVITGKNLDEADIKFGGVDAQEEWHVSSTRVVAKFAGFSGAIDVTAVSQEGVESANTAKDDMFGVGAVTTPALSATTGPATGKNKITITAASGLAGASQVFVYSPTSELLGAARLGKGTDTTLPITLPAGLPSGALTFTINTPHAAEQVLTGVTYTTVPVVSKVTPALVDAQGGDLVTVSGFGLTGLTASTVANDGSITGGVLVDNDAVEFVGVSDTELVFRARPAAAHGGGAGSSYEVFAGGSNYEGYRPVKIRYAPVPNGSITEAASVLPKDADGQVGTKTWQNVTVTGTNLKGAKVRVNNIAVPTVTSTDTSLTFKVVAQPDNTNGWTVTLTNSFGTRAVGALRWTDQLNADATTLAPAAAGKTVYVEGTNFLSMPKTGGITTVDGAGAVTSGIVSSYEVLSDGVLKVVFTQQTAGTAGSLVLDPIFGTNDTVPFTYV